MTKRLFLRCNGGHYFQGASCPFDAWSMPGVTELVAKAEMLVEKQDLSLERLVALTNPSPELLRRLLVIEFGSDGSVFEALVPDRFIYRGEEVPWSETGDELN